MKELFIKNSKLTTLVDDDIHSLYNSYNWYLCSGYVCYGSKDENFKSYEKLHRIVIGAKDGEIVDHIDRNKLNNQRSNLRIVKTKDNVHNSNKRKKTSCNYKGVSYVSKIGLYQARCRINGIDYFLGHFETEISAAYAYNKKASELSKYILLNNLGEFSNEELEFKLIQERRASKKHLGSKYKYIGFKKKSGRMKCDKFFILFTINGNRTYHGYFDTEEEAFLILKEKYHTVLNDIGTLKQQNFTAT